MIDRKRAVVIGAGAYGLYFSKKLIERGYSVICVESSTKVFSRASRNNQARVHNGYHYPRSLRTAARSRILSDRFIQEYGLSVIKNFQHRYLISAVDSKVTPKQFEYFMQSIGAPLFEDESWRKKHTDCYLVDKAYIAEEYAFDWKTLSHTLLEQLERAKRFEIIFNFEVTAINNNHGIYTLFSSCGEHVEADVVVNATYSNINKVSCMLSESSQVKLKHELTELALVEPPPELEGFAVTVMCGPFFSLMPYPSEGAYSLSHVRYTPHVEWRDVISKPPYRVLEQHIKTSNFNWMKLDASRFIPSLRGLDYKSSIWEVKSVLEKSELNDDRPVLFKRDGDFYQVFGGKIDNIFELDSLVEESFSVR